MITAISFSKIAWLTVAGAWFATFCTAGFSNALGVFQAYYTLHQLSNESQSAIGWVGSLNLGTMFFSMLVVGALSKRVGNPRVSSYNL
jgi:MFS family permease